MRSLHASPVLADDQVAADEDIVVRHDLRVGRADLQGANATISRDRGIVKQKEGSAPGSSHILSEVNEPAVVAGAVRLTEDDIADHDYVAVFGVCLLTVHQRKLSFVGVGDVVVKKLDISPPALEVHAGDGVMEVASAHGDAVTLQVEVVGVSVELFRAAVAGNLARLNVQQVIGVGHDPHVASGDLAAANGGIFRPDNADARPVEAAVAGAAKFQVFNHIVIAFDLEQRAGTLPAP